MVNSEGWCETKSRQKLQIKYTQNIIKTCKDDKNTCNTDKHQHSQSLY